MGVKNEQLCTVREVLEEGKESPRRHPSGFLERGESRFPGRSFQEAVQTEPQAQGQKLLRRLGFSPF